MQENKRKINYWLRAAIIVVCLIAFAIIKNLVMLDSISAFDDAVRYFFYELRNPVLTTIFKGITFMGNSEVVTTLAILLILIPFTTKFFGLPAGISALLSDFTNKFIKNQVQRTRPDKSMHLVEQDGFSFPSGHAMSSLVFYGTIAYSARRKLKEKGHPGWANAVTIVLALLIFLIGISRVYVGVHFMSDVLAGWLMGGALLTLFITIRETIENKLIDRKAKRSAEAEAAAEK